MTPYLSEFSFKRQRCRQGKPNVRCGTLYHWKGQLAIDLLQTVRKITLATKFLLLLLFYIADDWLPPQILFSRFLRKRNYYGLLWMTVYVKGHKTFETLLVWVFFFAENCKTLGMVRDVCPSLSPSPTLLLWSHVCAAWYKVRRIDLGDQTRTRHRWLSPRKTGSFSVFGIFRVNHWIQRVVKVQSLLKSQTWNWGEILSLRLSALWVRGSERKRPRYF